MLHHGQPWRHSARLQAPKATVQSLLINMTPLITESLPEAWSPAGDIQPLRLIIGIQPEHLESGCIGERMRQLRRGAESAL